MILDCFIFYNELDLLKLRLEYYFDLVDKFVIVEAKESFTKNKKSLFFEENKVLFEKYKEKIIYSFIEEYPYQNPWENEFYMRSYFKQLIKNIANDDDLIVLSDIDEIINIPSILANYKINRPTFIEMHCYYYFLNLRSTEIISIPLIVPYKYIKDEDCGNRYQLKKKLDYDTIYIKDINTGGHFTYQFGLNIEKYILKVKNFSHQEYNTSYFMNKNRIKFCIKYGKDLFERHFFYTIIPLSEIYDDRFKGIIINFGLHKNLVKKDSFALMQIFNIYFYIVNIHIFSKRVINKIKRLNGYH